MSNLFSAPNKITIIRVLLIPVFILFLLMKVPYKEYIAAFIFIILSLSDALDGYIARKRRQVTDFGKIIDPIADKLLISAALIFLIGKGVDLWMAVTIIAREVIMTFLRLLALPRGTVIAASYLGKTKTISQTIAIIAVIINLPYSWYLMLIAVILTVVSGIDYIVKMIKLLKERILNIPNIITTLRLALIPLFIINLLNSRINISLIIFAIIVGCDKLDGISARITKQITEFGRIYDALTDFIFIAAIFITFFILNRIEINFKVILFIPLIVSPVLKTFYYIKNEKLPESVIGKVVIGLVYLTAASFLIDFMYKREILIITAFLAYINMIKDFYINYKGTSVKSKFFPIF